MATVVDRDTGAHQAIESEGLAYRAVLALADQTRRLTIPEPSVRSSSPSSISDLGPPARRGIPPAPSRHPRAKALWGYNESGQVSCP